MVSTTRKELMKEIVVELFHLHESTGAYWINNKWVREKVFGYPKNEKQKHAFRNRIYRAVKTLEEMFLVKRTTRWEVPDNKNGKSPVVYLHYNTSDEVIDEIILAVTKMKSELGIHEIAPIYSEKNAHLLERRG